MLGILLTILKIIGWTLLASLPSGIFASIGNIVSSNAFIVGLFSLVGSLFVAPVLVYIFSTEAGFYEILAGHLIKETKPVPVGDDVVALAEPEEKLEETAEEKPEEAAEEKPEETAEATAEEAEVDPVDKAIEEVIEENAKAAEEAAAETVEKGENNGEL